MRQNRHSQNTVNREDGKLYVLRISKTEKKQNKKKTLLFKRKCNAQTGNQRTKENQIDSNC